MAHSHFDTFLREATYLDTASGSRLDGDALYGLYISWCFIAQQAPASESAFWHALHERVNTRHAGLRMKGPAAADYILTSYPALV